MLEKFLLALYAFTVWFFWAKTPFTKSRRGIFSISMLPLFIGLMFLNIWLTDTYLPDLMGALDTAREADEKLKASGVPYRRSQMQEPLVAFAISTPVAVLLSIGWFFLFLKWERNAQRKAVANTTDTVI